MTRRAFVVCLVGGLLVASAAGVARPAGKVYRIGVLEPYAAADPINTAMRKALREVGYVEGRDIAIEWRHGEGRTAQFPSLAVGLTQLKLDAIIAIGNLAIRAVRQATTTTPIVAAADDLVGEGHVGSLARPGGNLTGVSILGSELNAKRLELLREAVPRASRVAVLWDPATGTFHLPALHAAARTLGVELNVQEVRDLEDLHRAFAATQTWRAGALNVLASPLLHALRRPIINHAARRRLPAIYQWDESVRAGGLMSYGPTRSEVFRTMSIQLDRVLKGAKPADLPVEQPTRFELVINLKTAKAIGVTFPSSILVRADQVIQ